MCRNREDTSKRDIVIRQTLNFFQACFRLRSYQRTFTGPQPGLVSLGKEVPEKLFCAPLNLGGTPLFVGWRSNPRKPKKENAKIMPANDIFRSLGDFRPFVFTKPVKTDNVPTFA